MPNQQTQSAPVPGHKTSEFKVVLIAQLPLLLSIADLIVRQISASAQPGSWVAIGASAVLAALTASNYISGRSDVKVAAINANAATSQSAGDVLKNAGAQIANNEVERATGVDLGEELRGVFGLTSHPNADLDFGVTEPFPRGVADTLDPSYFAEGDSK